MRRRLVMFLTFALLGGCGPGNDIVPQFAGAVDGLEDPTAKAIAEQQEAEEAWIILED